MAETRARKRSHWRPWVTIAALATVAIARVVGQTVTVTVTEWDLPGVTAGTGPGALFISDAIAKGTGHIWYVTRGYPTALIKFTPTSPTGTWTRWPVDPAGTSGGLKVTRGGVVFVNLADKVVRIDTARRSNARPRNTCSVSGMP